MYERERETYLTRFLVSNITLSRQIFGHLAKIAYVHGTLTVHYIDPDYALQSYLPETKEFTQSHTGVNIADSEEIKSSYNG